MTINVVTGLIAALFLAVAVLLGYGALAFSRSGHASQPTRVNMAREVLWTGLASLLLLGLFLYAHP
jgi:heme/copper-type cytochrome/quinol oxidase subunit 2